MATKKQKHAEAVARRQEFLEKELQRGLEALAIARKKRELERRDEWKEQHEEKHYKFIDECPLCQDIKKDLKRKEAKKAVGKVAKARVNA